MILNQAWSLLLISLAAALLPGISRMLRLPAIVCEILFGVILGKSLLQLQFTGEWISFLAQLGFLLLMFQAGLEIDFSMFRQQNVRQLFVQTAIFAGTLGFALISAFALERGLFVALILSTTSLGLVVPTLRELGITKTPLGQSILIAATFADFLTLLGITFYVLWHQYGLSWHFLGPVPLFLGFGLLFKIGRLWAWWQPEKAARLLAFHDTQELGVRLSMALLFLFVAASELVHLEPVLGAFLGGAGLSIIFREKAHLEIKLSGIGYGFLIPIFFIHVGMQFDLANIISPAQIIFTLKLLGFALAVKLLPSLFLLFNHVSVWKSFNVGLLLSSRLSLIIVAASIGVKWGFITTQMKDAVVLLAIVTCLLGPSLFKFMHKTEDADLDRIDDALKSRPWPGWMRGRNRPGE